MRTILVDDEPLALERFEKISGEIENVEIIGKFNDPNEAIEFAYMNPIDLAVLDIEMPEISGIGLAKILKRICPDILIIFITGYEQYALKAYELHAISYLLKPYMKEDVEYAIQTAELLSKRKRHKVVIKTFGMFDVFVDGEPVFFKSSKAKELLALLVDAKGSTLTSGYAISLLWEDKPFTESSQSLYYKAAKSLEKTLGDYEIDHIIIKTRYERCVNRKEFECDYYEFLKENETAVRSFRGEYMSQYSWAEETLAGLFRLRDRMSDY